MPPVKTEVIWEPQPRQAAFITCPVDDVGFGGARGGGKSDGVIGDWINHEHTYGQHAIGIAFRRERTQLIELIERAKQILKPLGYDWKEVDKVFVGPKGGRLRFAYLESDSDADAYQGHSYTRIYPEEMGTFPSEDPINKLQSTLRSGNGVPCQMKGTCNPGGAGHQWVKARYQLDRYPKGFEIFESEFTNPFTKKKIKKTRVFIPSLVTDNRFLGDDYVANLYQVGSATLVKAWLEGDWSIVEGAYFPEVSAARHFIRPVLLPAHWTRARSFDWGSARPFSCGWWAIASEDFRHPDGFVIPRGAAVRYREWYGASSPNVGLRLTAEEVAHGIMQRQPIDEKIHYSIADPAIFSQDGGPSIAERMWNGSLRPAWGKADNARVGSNGHMGGWDLLRARLKGEDYGTPDWQPMLYVFDTCRDWIRTVPALQHEEKRPEDVDSDMEDHAADDTRYFCASRPWLSKPKAPAKIEGLEKMTMNDLWKQGRPKASQSERI